MYILGSERDYVYEYSLSTAWNPSTRTSTYNYVISPTEVVPQGLYFKPDGTKMYIAGSYSDAVKEYNLSVAWDLSTVSYVGSKSVAAQSIFPTGLQFKPDGTKMYICDGYIYEYNLSTPWSVTTASYSQSSYIGSLDDLTGLFFKPDGTRVYLSGYFGATKIAEYSMDAWDLSTIYVSGEKQLNNNATSGFYIKSDGTELFVIAYQGGGISAIYKYTFGL